VLATLIRLVGDFDLAEEALHEAFATAVERWPRDGLPANPFAWLVSTGRFGTYHGANEGYCSRFEMAQAIVEAAGIKSCKVEPCSSTEFPLPAPRPRMEAIEGVQARLIGLAEQPHWRDALGGYIRSVLL